MNFINSANFIRNFISLLSINLFIQNILLNLEILYVDHSKLRILCSFNSMTYYYLDYLIYYLEVQFEFIYNI